jgi:hypothetical protein
MSVLDKLEVEQQAAKQSQPGLFNIMYHQI